MSPSLISWSVIITGGVPVMISRRLWTGVSGPCPCGGLRVWLGTPPSLSLVVSADPVE